MNASQLSMDNQQTQQLADNIKRWGAELGFQYIGITDTQLATAEQYLQQWLDKDYHGDMKWMANHGTKRSRPAELVENTVRVISARMDYWPNAAQAEQLLQQPEKAYVSRYALGRDYHKLLRQRLQKLATRIENEIGTFGYRVFVDSAPVLEKPLAEKAGLGWQGKHTNLIDKQTGSWFFLGEIYVDIPLPVDTPAENHCGTCQSCIEVCPTRAIIAPYLLDARLCISYLTIEHEGEIPEALRAAMGNRIYGCDDCQLCCPWNRFAQPTKENDFQPRHQLDSADLLTLFQWDEATFLKNTEGSAIRRIGHQRWIRNIAIALGNAPGSEAIIAALKNKRQLMLDNEMVLTHIDWALQQHHNKNC